MSDYIGRLEQVKVICKQCAEVLAWITDYATEVPGDPTMVEIVKTELCWQYRDPALTEFQREHDANRKIGPNIWPKHATLIGGRRGGITGSSLAQAPQVIPLWCSRDGQLPNVPKQTLISELAQQRLLPNAKVRVIRI